MKKLLSILTLCMGLCCVSCYDDSALVERIDALEQSTIASLKASISSLESQSGDIKSSIASLEQSGNANATEIAALKTSLGAIEAKIEELKSWVEKLLEGYYTKEEIDAQIQSLNTEIETLRTKISSIESKLDILMRDFVISFDDTEIGILAGGTTSVGYIITGATEKTTVKALGQNGWSAKVTPDGTDKGKITVTAPDPLTEDEIIVLVYDGEFRTIMSSINFVTGVVTPSQTAVELEAEAGTVDITITSNLNYAVYIPEGAKNWLSLIETKTMRNDVITFSFTSNNGFKRTAKVLIESNGNIITNIAFIQKGLANGVTVNEPGTLLNIIENEDLWSADKLKISGELNDYDWKTVSALTSTKYMDLSDVTNTYILKGLFKGNSKLETLLLPQGLLEVPESLCEDCIKLQSIKLPTNVVRIGKNAFKNTYEVQGDLIIPDSVIEIKDGAFWASHDVVHAEDNRIKLEGSLYLGKNLKTIGEYAFARNGYRGTLDIPNSVQYIGAEAFKGGCYSGLELSKSLNRINMGTFASCDFEGEIVIPEGVEYIEGNAFEYCRKITKVTFPKTLKELVGNTKLSAGTNSYGQGGQFHGCDKLTSVEIPNTITYIPALAFLATGIRDDLVIPDNIIEIGCGAFSNCKGIKTVTLGRNVQYLRTYTKYPFHGWVGIDSPFDGCSQIQKIYCKNPIPPICEHSLPFTNYLGVPKDGVEAYKSADIWKDFSVIIAVEFE